MTSTEAPFRATLPIDIMGTRILLTSGADTCEQFMEQWAHLAQEMAIVIKIFKTCIATANADPLVGNSWGEATVVEPAPAPAPAPAPMPAAPAAPAPNPWGAPVQAAPQQSPMCDHGQPMKLVPAGVSKSTGKPYRGFYACAAPREQQCGKRITV